MQCAHDRYPSRMRDFAHQSQDRNCRVGVKARYRFIRKQDPALLRECARYRDPLLLPTRQGVGALVQMIREAYRRKGVGRPLHIILGERADDHPPQWRCRKSAGENVVEGRQAPNQVELLEDDAQLASLLCQGASAQAVEAPSTNLYPSAIRFNEPRKTTE